MGEKERDYTPGWLLFSVRLKVRFEIMLKHKCRSVTLPVDIGSHGGVLDCYILLSLGLFPARKKIMYFQMIVIPSQSDDKPVNESVLSARLLST